MNFLLTGEIVRRLGITESRLDSLIRTGRLASPTKDSAGRRIWSPDDLERVRAAMAVDRRRTGSRVQPSAPSAGGQSC